MELTTGVYGLPLDVSLGDQKITLSPVAVETRHGVLLLDVGLPDGLDDLSAALAENGLEVGDTWAVVVTHHDFDHAGCLAAVVDHTDAVVFTHEDETPYLEGDMEPLKSGGGQSIRLEPTTVDVRLAGGETFATIAGPMNAIHTPGHTPGHTSYYFPEDRLLVAGDALNVVEGELVGPREDVTLDFEMAWESVEAIASLEIEHTFCFHGGYVEVGTERIDTLLDQR
ncbi:MBL fold metallo-hydrolase [Haloferax sp. MBLA0076]|uniref:MBL fold metallo-hydrolase n=1 Tax=Haloferax litoreum TaxID=2666140 RepID=A0A6A8GK70_9EURY|nr:MULTISPECIES: MBL fold metallo-hydrolase [Haloferax]KAB1190592.1 MBL fold metallo-hydrolase [Haloferax sp. CBA1148]MRX23583.1 MBL fold metallo-hydrolase [Haloferax litoreum]